ncbi:hypothetical protein HN937_12625, partial [Candidatus Poribacteria bacterium]|nr:hypothetical protein [Candidatus Poribacteria bacterium]
MNQNALYDPRNLLRAPGQANPPVETISAGPPVPVGVSRGAPRQRTPLMEELSQSLKQVTFGEVMGGMALMGSALIPGMRGLVYDRVFA